MLFLGLISSCNEETEPPTTSNACDSLVPSYREDVLPIVENSCAVAGCHVANFSFGDFTDFPDLKGYANNGLLRSVVVVNQTMPPVRPLTQNQIDLFDCWIQNGALEN